MVIVYLLSVTTLIGLHAYNFITVYVFISLNSELFTYLDFRIAYYLLMDPYQVTHESHRVVYILIPFMLVLATGIIGAACRFGIKKLSTRSVVCNYIYYLCSWKLMFTVWGMMLVPIFANAAFILQGRVVFNETSPVLINFIIYFSFASVAFYTYLTLLLANPQIG